MKNERTLSIILIVLLILLTVFTPRVIIKITKNYMAIDVWGTLPKSQTDDETIEEAIDRLIAVHDDNENAHIGAGKSLNTHKAQEVVDHPAYSVVRDKIKFDRFIIDEDFIGIEAWSKSAGVSNNYVAEMIIETGVVINTIRHAFMPAGESMEEQPYQAQNPNWETRVKFSDDTNQDIYLGTIDDSLEFGWGFKIIDNEIFYWYVDGDENSQSAKIADLTSDEWMTFRCELVNGVTLKFYINGVLKHTVNNPSIFNFGSFMGYYVKNTAAASKYLYITSMHWDGDYLP